MRAFFLAPALCVLTLLMPVAVYAGPSGKGKLSTADRLADLLTLELEYAESQFALTKNVTGFQKVISLHEKLALLTCMPNLKRKLEYDGPPENKSCERHRNFLRKVQPQNPVGVCAEAGLNSSDCVEAYDGQYVSTIRKKSLDILGVNALDLEFRLAKPVDPIASSSLLSRLKKQISDMKKGVTEADKLRFEETSKKLLGTACRDSSVYYPQSRPADSIKAASLVEQKKKEQAVDETKKLILDYANTVQKRKDKKSSELKAKQDKARKLAEKDYLEPMAFEEDAFGKVEKDPSGKKKAIKMPALGRIRYISPQCKQAVTTINKVRHSLPHPTCMTEGYTSPRCIAAIKRYRTVLIKRKQQNAIKAGGTPIPTQGLGTF